MSCLMSSKQTYGLLAALALTTLSGPAGAITILYDLTPLGGNTYRYDYAIGNDGSLPGSAAIEGFQIEFANADVSSIVSTAAIQATWDEQILQQTLTDPDIYDALAKSGGIANGTSLSGFAVEFTWNGAGLPGGQAFSVYDPQTFQPLAGGAGITQPAQIIPEPATLNLIALGLPGLAGWRRRTCNS